MQVTSLLFPLVLFIWLPEYLLFQTAGYSNLNPSMRLSSLPGSRLGIPSPADLPLMASQLGPTLGVAGNLNGAFQPKVS